MRFYKNVIGEDGGEMNRADMMCTRLFEDPGLLRNVDPKDALRKGRAKGFESTREARMNRERKRAHFSKPLNTYLATYKLGNHSEE